MKYKQIGYICIWNLSSVSLLTALWFLFKFNEIWIFKKKPSSSTDSAFITGGYHFYSQPEAEDDQPESFRYDQPWRDQDVQLLPMGLQRGSLWQELHGSRSTTSNPGLVGILVTQEMKCLKKCFLGPRCPLACLHQMVKLRDKLKWLKMTLRSTQFLVYVLLKG